MANRYFNWKLAVVLLMGLAVLAATAFGLRHWQRGRRASQGLLLGNKAYSESRWEESANQFGRYLGVTPDDIPILLKYADSHLKIRPLKSGNVQQAIAAYRTILRLEPGYIEAALRLSGVYLGLNEAAEAEQVAARALQSAQSGELRRILAIALAVQRKFTDAANELENIIKDNSDDVQSYEIIGKLVEQRPQDFNVPAQFWFDEAVKKNPSLAQAFIIRGAYNLRRGEKTQAMADFNDAAKKDLSDPNIRLQLANQLIIAGDLEQARRHLDIVVGQNPSSQDLWRIWVQLAKKSGDTSLMLEVADNGLKSLSLQPWDFMPLAAEIYIRGGQLDKAADCILRLRQKDINPSAAAFLEGLLAEAKGQGYEAVGYWQKAMELGAEPANVRIMLARELSNLGDKLSAIKQLRALVSEQPNNFRARVELAGLLGEIGRWGESLEHAQVALKISPQNADAILTCARARVNLIAGKTPGYNSASAKELEEYLRKLDDVTGGQIDVKLLEVQLAVNIADFNQAESLLGQLKKEYSSDIRVILAETNLLVSQGKTGEAITLLTEAVDKSPDSVVLVKTLAGLLSAQDTKQQCEGVVSRAMANSREPSIKRQFGLLLASLYANWNEETKRCDLLAQLGDQFSDDIPVLRTMLTCRTVLKDLTRAQKIVDRIKNIEGEKGWQWRYEQARVWFAQEDFNSNYPQLVLLLKGNLLDNPDNQVSRMLLAAAYERAGDMRLAIATYEEALNHSPEDVRIMVVAAGALYKANEYDRADQILRRAAENRIEYPELKWLQLQSFIRRGELDSAGAVLEDLLAADPNNQSIGLSLAFLQMRQGRLDEAAKILDALSIGGPNSLSVAAAKVEINIRKGKTAEAISMCDNIVAKFNNASSLVLRARTYASLGQNDKAEADFIQAASIEPNNIDVLLAKSDFYRSINRIDKYIEDVRHALIISPTDLRAQKRAILLYLASSDSAMRREGISLLENTLKANPQDIELRLYKARLLISQGTLPSLEDAKSILETVTEQQPLSSEAWRLLAEVATRQGQSARAIDIALRGLAYRPNDKGLLLLRAKLLKERSPMLAVPILRTLLEMEPNNSEMAVYLAEAYIDAGEHGQAMALLKSQLGMQNTPAAERRLKIALAAATYKLGNRDEAEKTLDALQQSLPDDPLPLLAKIRLLKSDKMWSQINQTVTSWCQSHPNDVNVPLVVANELVVGQGDEPKKMAEDLLWRVLQQNTDSVEAMYSLAMLFQSTGRSTDAAKLYQRVLLLDSNNVVAVNNLAWILCEDQSQYQQALELADKGLAKEPNYVDLLDTRGVVYYRLGRFERAVEDLSRCVNLYPERSQSLVASYFHLARALAKLGRTTQAVENLKKALDLNNSVGGLAASDLTEARQLLEKLSEGGS
jgi:cellulose synthase operon protein C